jgi:uncharacterized membrane protein
MSANDARYIYASVKSYERAVEVLEDAYAHGEVSDAERPRIEKLRSYYVITLVDWVATNHL